VLGAGLAIQTKRLESTKAEYAAFVAQTKALGEAQIAKNKLEAAQREKVSNDRFNSLQKRYRDMSAKYDRLRGNSAGSGAMPAVPDATRPTDDSARDQRLLDVLQHAEKQTGQLIELQTWVKEQQAVK